MALNQIDAAVRGVGLIPAFQPIVSLPDETVVGYEALARWSPNYPDPQEVFARAKVTDSVDEIDRMCITCAIASALERELGHDVLLSINCEPTSATVRRSEDAVLARGHDELQLMFELTERSLLDHPHLLLQKVADLRGDGFAVALDDVGAQPDSLALLDVISPDVVKLDLGLIQSRPDYDQARTLSAVLAHHERTGAVILAEGIETDEHLEQALALGASLGQGYKFGRPGQIDQHPATTKWVPPVKKPHSPSTSGSPFDIVRDHCPTRRATKATLTAFSRQIEIQAQHATDPPILLTALQHARYFSGRAQREYCELATRSPLVAVFGQQLPADLGPGVRGVALHAGDILRTEWVVLTLGPHTATALIAREHHDQGKLPSSDQDRRFDFLITYDRSLVTAAARNLLDRMH